MDGEAVVGTVQILPVALKSCYRIARLHRSKTSNHNTVGSQDVFASRLRFIAAVSSGTTSHSQHLVLLSLSPTVSCTETSSHRQSFASFS